MSDMIRKLNSTGKKRLFWSVAALAFVFIVSARLLFAGTEMNAHLYILGFSPSDASLLWTFKSAVILMEFAVAVLALYTVLFRSFEWHRLFTVLTLSFGLLFLFTVTPLSVPDEVTHYQAIYGLSCKWLGRDAVSSYLDFSGFANHSNVSTGYLRILHELGGRAADGTASAGAGNMLSDMWTLTYFVEYVPQLIGMSLALVLGRNMTTAFILGRFFNLAFYCLCVYLAVKRTPKFKLLFGLCALMPMALQQAASLSYDAFIDSLSILLASSLMYSVFSEDAFSVKELMYILIPAVLLAPAKGIYSLFVLLFLFVPKKRFDSFRIRKSGVFFIILGSCAALFALVSVPSIVNIMHSVRPGFEFTGDECYKLSYFFTAPFDALKIFADSFDLYISDWIASAIGKSLSTSTLSIPSWIVPVYISCLVLSVQNRFDEHTVMPKGFRVCLIGISAFIIFAFMMTMFLAWIRNTDKIILGVQGRYFIPIIPLLGLSLNSKLVELKRDVSKNLVITVILLILRVILEIVIKTMSASV